MVMKPALLSIAGLFSLCALQGCIPRAFAQASPTASTAGYTLEARTAIKNGIRAYPETVYTYSRQFPGGLKTELWRITLQDKYAHHWIGENGKVWVLTA